ncbi:hypothetical protein EDC04DRAFT_2996601 [Pisolithus marmoratus]|nr:hypothetical protein EDC04DRAFT_2996601 [Pisolithus marmoratus]
MSKLSANKFYNSYRWIAIVLYDRLLNEGFAPSSSIRRSLRTNPGTFMQLLYVMLSSKKVPVQLVDNLARVHVTIRNIETCSFRDLVGEVAKVNESGRVLQRMQTYLIDPSNTFALKEALAKMRTADVPPTVSVSNTLIHVKVTQQRFGERRYFQSTLTLHKPFQARQATT